MKNYRNLGLRGRWFLNSVVIIFFILLCATIAVIASIRNWYYSSAKQLLTEKTELITGEFVAGSKNNTDLISAAHRFIEQFSEKEEMEIMILDEWGDVIRTSSGFSVSPQEKMPDYDEAISSVKAEGFWIGGLTTGESVMACTKKFSLSNETGGTLRVVVSLTNMDRQLLVISLFVTFASAMSMFFIVLSGFYFLSSIISPVRKISATAQLVARGNFDVRLEKKHNDEIGELCDTVNEMADELGKADKLKNDFVSSISHELRTPLTSIKGWAETIKDNVENEPEMAQKGLEIIIKESEHLSQMVEELLDFSRLQSGRLQIQKQKMDIIAELQQAICILQEHAKRQNVRIDYTETSDIIMILGDERRILQVFLNIIENAIKYSDSGGEIKIRATKTADTIEVLVVDNGCGIPAKDLPKIKEKFYRANITRPGSGIGLALADDIVTLHGGTLEIDSKENYGTTVLIKFPIYKKSNAAKQ